MTITQSSGESVQDREDSRLVCRCGLRRCASSLEGQCRRCYTTDRPAETDNRSCLDELLLRQKAHCERCGSSFALLMRDVDGFKLNGDTHNQLEGDSPPRRVVSLLHGCSRTIDSLATHSAEQFALVMRGP